MDLPNLRILDVACWGLRLLVTASRCPGRPLVEVSLWRYPRAFCYLILWRREAHCGL